jgi:hypothetical protein
VQQRMPEDGPPGGGRGELQAAARTTTGGVSLEKRGTRRGGRLHARSLGGGDGARQTTHVQRRVAEDGPPRGGRAELQAVPLLDETSSRRPFPTPSSTSRRFAGILARPMSAAPVNAQRGGIQNRGPHMAVTWTQESAAVIRLQRIYNF